MKIPSTLRWKPVRQLGEGGQGTVFSVTDSTCELEGEFALKILRRGQPQKAYERFAREIEAIKSIDHPGIVRIVDHSEPEQDFQFYVMEYQPGAKSLKQLLGTSDNPFRGNPLKSLGLFMEIVGALRACEEKGIVHRDLSPANAIVLKDERIKLIDFGLCQISDHEQITLVDEGVGTPNYMAPECESGVGGAVTSRADLYSAGKILWSAISNKNAFAREEPVFNSFSMSKLFPDNPTAWHLCHMFESTIRRSPDDRAFNCGDAIRIGGYVHRLMSSGVLPLELLSKQCPACQWGQLRAFEQSHSVFGNPNPRGISAVQCSYCGYCYAIDYAGINQRISDRAKLS